MKALYETSDTKEQVVYGSGSNLTAIMGEDGVPEIRMDTPITPIDLYVHSHYGTGTLPIFSGADIYSLYLMLINGSINNPSIFTFGLVTGYGTTYLLMIENVDQFRMFGQKYFGSSTEFVADELIAVNGALIVCGVTEEASPEVGERGFLNFLRTIPTGLSLFKGNINGFGLWEKREVKDNKVYTISCP